MKCLKKCILFQCGLPTLEECKELADNAHAEGEIFQAVKYYLLSAEPEKALPIGISFVKGVRLTKTMSECV